MSANTKAIKQDTGNSNLLRPRYSPGLLLRDDDLKQGVDYTRDLSRLLFRSLIGCGVVCGLKVKPEFKCDKLTVTIADGLALDCHGDPIHVPQPHPITIDSGCGEAIPEKIWIVIRRTEKCCAPRSAACSCDDEETPAVCTRERDGYEIRILPQPPECACGCIETKTTNRVIQQQASTEAKTKLAKKAQSANTGSVALVEAETTAGTTQDCQCVDRSLKCYEDYDQGMCGCDCTDCDCEWVVLALLEEDKSNKDNRSWKTNHSVRRFVRPILMRDPVAWAERPLEVKK